MTQYLRYTFDDFLQPFENYNFKMEKFLIDQFSDYARQRGPLPPLSKMTRRDLMKYSKESHEYIMFYPQSFRSSFCIQLFSVLEYELKEICMIHHVENNTTFSINDLKGNGEIEKAILYLKKAANVNPAILSEWNFLDTVQVIRNLLVHHQGEISTQNSNWSKIKTFIKSNQSKIGFSDSSDYYNDDDFKKLLELQKNFYLEIRDAEFNSELINKIKHFLSKIVLQLQSAERDVC